MDEGSEAAAGDHDEAVVDLVDVGIFYAAFLAASVALAAAQVDGVPVGWGLVAAPALLPLAVLAVVLLVQAAGDAIRGERAGRPGDLWIDRP